MCDNMPVQIPDNGRMQCCGRGAAYDTTEYDCRNNIIHPKKETKGVDLNSRFTNIHEAFGQAACGSSVINIKTNLCCNGVINSWVGGANTMCCNTKAYDPTKNMCCSDGNTLLPMTSDPSMTACCGTGLYNPGKSMCCGGTVQPIIGTAANTGCCGTASYNLTNQMCSRGRIANK